MKESTIDLTPSWEEVVSIYIAVLQNENAGFEAVKAAKEELIRLARWADKMQSKGTLV